jgi:hypothetical protein
VGHKLLILRTLVPDDSGKLLSRRGATEPSWPSTWSGGRREVVIYCSGSTARASAGALPRHRRGRDRHVDTVDVYDRTAP